MSEDEIQKLSVDTLRPTCEYELKIPPPYYIQGSYVLDKIFGKNFARDIDVFIPQGSKPPVIKDKKFIHIVELQEDLYFPPSLGCYNTDRYLLVGGDIIAPKGFPKKPEFLELLGGYGLTVVDVIRGIKTSLRYGLSAERLQEAWRMTLQREFDPEWMKLMFFESKQEVLDYIMDNVNEETGDSEREAVNDMVKRLLFVLE